MRAILTSSFIGLVAAAGFAESNTPATQLSDKSGPAVLVLPFADQTGSAGKLLQQDLAANLAGITRARISAPSQATPANDSDQALARGREAGAASVVFGQVQNSGRELRITGQVLDVTSGKATGGLKATGPIDNVFPLEDALARQVAVALPPDLSSPAAKGPAQDNLGAQASPYYQSYTYPDAAPWAGITSVPGGYYSHRYVDPDYAYHDDSYSDAWLYAPAFFLFGDYYYICQHHHHDHDHDHDHGHDWHDMHSPGFHDHGANHPGSVGHHSSSGSHFGSASTASGSSAGHSGGGGHSSGSWGGGHSDSASAASGGGGHSGGGGGGGASAASGGGGGGGGHGR